MRFSTTAWKSNDVNMQPPTDMVTESPSDQDHAARLDFSPRESSPTQLFPFDQPALPSKERASVSTGLHRASSRKACRCRLGFGRETRMYTTTCQQRNLLTTFRSPSLTRPSLKFRPLRGTKLTPTQRKVQPFMRATRRDGQRGQLKQARVARPSRNPRPPRPSTSSSAHSALFSRAPPSA
ncbi:hypothetical protein BKA81DRAFT_373723 [Phyllosticta paracitricarpa]